MRRHRFGLRTMLVVITLLACCCAVINWLGLLDTFRLERISYGEKSSVAFATASLDSRDPLVQRAAISAMGRIGPSARTAVPNLLEILAEDRLSDDPSVDVPTDSVDDVPWAVYTNSSAAAWAIGNIGTTAPEAHKALQKALKSKNRHTRRYAVYAFSCLGATAPSAIPDLTAALDDDRVSYIAARALGESGPQAIDAIPKLTELLSPANDARAEAAIALASLSAYCPLPDETLTKLQALKNDSEDYVRKTASEAMILIELHEQLDGTP